MIWYEGEWSKKKKTDENGRKVVVEKRERRDHERREETKTHLFGFLDHHILIRPLLQSTRVHCMLPVHELLFFPPCHEDLLAVCYDNVVTTVD
jgi:hypothetical protein